MIQILKPNITYVKGEEMVKDRKGTLIVEPLERGWGITVGNSLRRILLSSIPGAAVYAIKVDGVLHEFSTIPGVREDLVRIIMNLKNVVLKLVDVPEYKLTIDVKGEKVLTAGELAVPGNVEVLNPDHVIAHLNKDAHLNMEIFIKQGRGYVPAEKQKAEDKNEDISVVYIDANFSPIKKVKYEVMDTRVGFEINYDKLIMDIETNGAITPLNAIHIASRMFLRHLELFAEAKEEEVFSVDMVTSEKEVTEKSHDIPIRELEFSVRARNCLKRANIKALGELTKMTAQDLMAIKNFGKKSLTEIREKLRQYGLCLKGEEDTLEDNQGPIDDEL